MTLAETVAQTTASLPPDKQREVLDFAEFLKSKTSNPSPLKSLYGICKGQSISEEDLAKSRQEMWGSYMADVQ